MELSKDYKRKADRDMRLYFSKIEQEYYDVEMELCQVELLNKILTNPIN